uniref:FAD-binding PCMH-type domain-containing protein n=1 Tax=Fagus sylvatica TaxID=28930 RepID=A0A2N9FH01_FAGSY
MPKTTLLTPAVVCSKKNGLQIRIRSGGHDYAGISYVSDVPFIILDMFNLRSITVDMNEQTAWVQTGATLGELYYSIWKKSKVHAFPAGVCPTVGVGGHVSGAGYGNMLRKYGLTTDNVVDARIVDKTISVFRAERTLEENATDIVYRWQQVAPTTDENLFMRMLIQPSTSKVNKGAKTIKATIIAEFLGKADDVVALLGKEFPELGLKKEDVKEMSWIDSVLWWNQNNGTPEFLLDRNPNSANYVRRKSDYVQTPIPKARLEWLWQRIIENGRPGMVFNPYGGKMNKIPITETAFAHRAGNLFKIQYSVTWEDGGIEAENNNTAEIRNLYRLMTPFVSKNPRSAYLNYRDLDIGVSHSGSYAEGKVYGVKYFNQNFDRLVKVKTAVDPQNFFRNEQSIPTLSSK